MHFVMILGSLGLAWGLRYGCERLAKFQATGSTWQNRWQTALICFVVPPLLVIITAIAVLCMGTQGRMIGLPVGKFSYAAALMFLIYSAVRSIQFAIDGWRSLQKLQNLVIEVKEICLDPSQKPKETLRLLDIPMLFAAQIGFWRSQLLVSTGLLARLDQQHLQAVLLHEQAHAHYHDTFWFFWLGCLRQVMPWLTNTQVLWQELLLLRELRADRWAVQYADSLLVAESLLAMVSNNMQLTETFKENFTETFAAAFGATDAGDRLEERIEFLLAAPEPLPKFAWRSLLWMGLSLLPLALLPLHY
ncbi:MAG: hypothetical protein AUK48_03800 [Oscillatoriales cyanobacterium CG2_30_44_21]|nr:MAG: hypothetical protein AUK48_03800 [Oscillatoriales cyanobacterium CG2_30_44_21]